MKKENFIKALAVIMLTISLLSTNSITTLADENTSSTNTKVEITRIKTRESSPQVVGTKIKIGVAAKGEGLQYKYVVMKDCKVTYSKGYSKKNYTYWTPSEEGNYKIYCRVKNSAGINSLISMNFIIYDNKEAVVNDLINEANKHLGKPYEYGANGPNSFDCCGFVQYVYKNVLNVDIGRTTYIQMTQGTEVSQENLQPGDLVFPRAGHVGIYIGDGYMIHAPKTGDVIKVSPVYKFYTARRIL